MPEASQPLPDTAPDTVPEGGVVCATCGKVRPSASACGCGQAGPTIPEGWNPELTRTSRPRLPLTGPAPQAGDTAEPAAADPRREHDERR